MSLRRTAWTVFRKDLKIEMRTREIVSTTALFALLIVILSAFALDLSRLPGPAASAGVIWLAICFSGVLAIGRTWLREREFDVWSAVLMSASSRAGLYLGKMAGLLVFLLIVLLLLSPLVELFFHAPMLHCFPSLVPVFLLGTLGFSAVGTLFGSITVRKGSRDLLLGTILFPLVSPVLILSVKATAAILSGQSFASTLGILKFLLALDMLFLALGLWLFGFLMED